MKADEFRALLKGSSLSQRALALRLGVAISTVNRWAQGELPVPQYATAYLELWHSVQETVRSAER